MESKYKRDDVVRKKGDTSPTGLMDIINVVIENNQVKYECSWFTFAPMGIMSDFFNQDDLEYVYSRDNSNFIENFEKTRPNKDGANS